MFDAAPIDHKPPTEIVRNYNKKSLSGYWAIKLRLVDVRELLAYEAQKNYNPDIQQILMLMATTIDEIATHLDRVSASIESDKR